MTAWPDRRILDLFGVDLPIIQAPMSGFSTPELAVAVARAGGLGSLACAQLDLVQADAAFRAIREGAGRPVNVNFFCHRPPADDPARALRWRAALAPYYLEHGLDPLEAPPTAARRPFDADYCALVEAWRPEVVSFHFGLPEPALLARVRASGARIIASATTVAEARWLEARGCDAVIAMGLEAGGHRGSFLTDDMARQVGAFALVPQVADAVKVPVIAAGGIADGRGVAAAFALGAAAVLIGTAYLFSPECRLTASHRRALESAADDSTVVTNVFSGRPARGIVNRAIEGLGPMSDLAPAFPLAGSAVAPLRARTAETTGDFMSLWSGQSAALAARLPAGEFTRRLAEDALARMGR